eukprot:1159748-Pelagomonas_calceolata.AAC.2
MPHQHALERAQCPPEKDDITASIDNPRAEVLERRPFGATLKVHLFSAKMGAQQPLGHSEHLHMPSLQSL